MLKKFNAFRKELLPIEYWPFIQILYFIFLLIFTVFFSVTYTPQVYLRKMIKPESLNYFGLIMGILFVGFFGACCLFKTNYALNCFSSISKISYSQVRISGYLYCSMSILAIFIVAKDSYDLNKRLNTRPEYIESIQVETESRFLAFLKKFGASSRLIETIIEPLILLVLSVFLLRINLFLGLPLLISTLLYWTRQLINSILREMKNNSSI